MPKGRPRQFDTDKALDAALLLFWRHGYEGTSLSALTAAMGLNTPSLYAAFGNKEALFQRALDRYLQRPASYFPNALQDPSARRAVEKLLLGAIAMVMNPHHPDGCMLVHGALASGPGNAATTVREKLKRHRTGAQAALRRRLERAVAEGDLPSSARPAQLARFITTILWGLSVQAAGGATRAHLKEVVALTLQSWPAPAQATKTISR